jgi:hypothetical protein
MAKAFDTLSHKFLREVFKFFNMGPSIIRWLSLLGENRSACILLDDGTYSRSFRLDRGRAEGDNISPNTFNFGEQILIFKIELEPMITGVWKNFIIPQNINPAPENTFMFESRGETNKNESLADDNTTLMELTSQNLLNLRKILNDFGSISGLICNYEKTQVMPVGCIDNTLLDLHGLCLTNKIKLLGLEITNDLDTLSDAFLSIREKLLSLVWFWERFNLTLLGRIAIVKTLLISQINYLGSFLTPEDTILSEIQAILDNFALKNLNISVDRRYLKPEQGGLGLLNIRDFLIAQKCTWIKRAASNTIDNWRLTLMCNAPGGKILNIRACDLDPGEHLILRELAWAYEFFHGCFSLQDNNHTKNSIFQNAAFIRSKYDNMPLDANFFGKNFITKIKKQSENSLTSLALLRTILNQSMTLRCAVYPFRLRYG